MSRYSVSRKPIPWMSTPHFCVAKQLAGAIMKHEAVGMWDLWRRFEALYPDVSEIVIGERMTFKELRDYAERVTGGIKITANKLRGRGDVVNREGYKETDEWTIAVIETYLRLTNGQIKDLDLRRNFTDEEVSIAVIRQKKICFNPTCRAPFGPLNPPVGDHAMPHCLGGRTDQSNCVALCWRCNSSKGSLPLQEFIAKCAMNNAGARRRIV